MNESSRISDKEVTDLLVRRSARPVPDGLASAILESLASERARNPARTTGRSAKRPLMLLAAAALLLAGGALAAGSGALRLWSTTPPEPAPSFGLVTTPAPDTTTSGGMWPQSTQEEVRAAQERADAGDPDYTWQVDPSWSIDDEPLIGAEISERFLREGLGWEAFMPVSSAWYMAAGGPDVNAVVFIRCAFGRTNPLSSLYPDMEPEFRVCAPTLDDFRYETVRYTVGQPARQGPSGIWVVTEWEMLQPGEQAAPPSDAEVTALLQSFLGARLDGEGAEAYLLPSGETKGLPFVDGEAPLLHGTTGGSPYERSEIGRVQGPWWPAGWIESKVRLFAEDGTVVDQQFVVVRQENGRLGLVYGPASEYGDPPTIEDGQALYSLLDGEVTFAAASTWEARLESPTRMNFEFGCQGTGFCSDNVIVVADPPVMTGCEAGLAPADADALAGSIRSNPGLESTTPVAVTVGGIDALRMDVVAAPGAGVCDTGLVVAGGGLLPTDRMRLYLVDLPGASARVLSIAVIARDPYDKVEVSQQDFEQLVEASRPIVESIEFHTP